jgi:hypothetical protein
MCLLRFRVPSGLRRDRMPHLRRPVRSWPVGVEAGCVNSGDRGGCGRRAASLVASGKIKGLRWPQFRDVSGDTLRILCRPRLRTRLG